MSLALAYWIALFIWIVFAGAYGPRPWGKASIPDVLLIILLGLIGWALFGQPVHR